MDSQPSQPPKPTRGRPKKFIDLELIEKLAHIQCTSAEIAATLGISLDTLLRHKDFKDVYKRGAEGGRKSLRRIQFESANRGNVVMQIWLGKQYLGQADHVKTEIRRVPSLSEMTTEELQALIAEGGLDCTYTVVPPEPTGPALIAAPVQDDQLSGDSDKKMGDN